MGILTKGELLLLALLKEGPVYVHKAMNYASDYYKHGDLLNCNEYYAIAVRDGHFAGAVSPGCITKLIACGDLIVTREKPVVFREGQIVRYTLPDGSYSFCFIVGILSEDKYFVSFWNKRGAKFAVSRDEIVPVELIEKP